MKTSFFFVLLTSYLIGLSLGVADEKPAQQPDQLGLVTCSTATENRTLAIATKEGGGCDLHYEKYGKDKVISWSSSSVTPCINSRDKVKKELIAAGWKCFQE